MGVTGSGKTFTMAHVIKTLNKPTLIMAPNKTLAAQLYGEMKEFFPENAVEYFVSYYDYYQPEAYVPRSDTFIEKESSINEQIDRMRHSATRSLLERNDVIIVASVSCIYGIGSVETYSQMTINLKKGDNIKEKTNLEESILVFVEGYGDIEVSGKKLGKLGTRSSVFEKKPPSGVYIPLQTEWTISASTNLVLAVCSAPGKEGFLPSIINSDEIKLIERGKGSNKRHIFNIAMEDNPIANSLLVTEVFTPQGNWSSYPPHRHDENDFPNITYLEETYYHRINPNNGFGFQRVFSEDGTVDQSICFNDGDVVLVPKGHHPCGIPYGYELYYLNVMAGPIRKWRFKNHPDFEWLYQRDQK